MRNGHPSNSAARAEDWRAANLAHWMGPGHPNDPVAKANADALAFHRQNQANTNAANAAAAQPFMPCNDPDHVVQQIRVAENARRRLQLADDIRIATKLREGK